MASHAQKYHLRQKGVTKRRSRFSAIEERLQVPGDAGGWQPAQRGRPRAVAQAVPPPGAPWLPGSVASLPGQGPMHGGQVEVPTAGKAGVMEQGLSGEASGSGGATCLLLGDPAKILGGMPELGGRQTVSTCLR